MASRAIWETMAPKLDDTPVNRLSVSKTKQVLPTMRHRHRPIMAFRANWEEALAEAIAAGTPKIALNRPRASIAEWNAALTEAVLLSQARPVYSAELWRSALARAVSLSQPCVRYPEYPLESWNTALVERVVKTAIPVTVNSIPYDASIRHPVFFGTLMVCLCSKHGLSALQ